MKKLLLTLALMLLAFTGNAQFAKWMKPSKVSSAILKGDANGDGGITVADVMLTVSYALGKQGESFNAANADINGDGEITVADVMLTVSTILEGNSGGGNGSGIGDTSQAYLTCPDDSHPHMIDLGLPSGTLWACCNVDANNPEDYGGYYAWGETEEKAIYNEVTYQYCTGVDEDGYGWYVNKQYQVLGDIAGSHYDVAQVKWGGSWVMPSLKQIEELVENCSYYWTTKNGVEGGCFTSSNGGTIFLPAAGYHLSDKLYGRNSNGQYWSSTQSPKGEKHVHAYRLTLHSDRTFYTEDGSRFYGFTVRPVWVP